MRSIIEWLLDLELIDLHDGSEIDFQWLEPLDGWLWFILFLAVPAYVLMIYRHDGGRRISRAVMGFARASVILLALALLCRPALIHRRDRTEPSTVVVMVDRSASMALADHYRPDRWAALSGLIPQSSATPVANRWTLAAATMDPLRSDMLTKLLEKHELRVYRFAGSISEPLDIQDAKDLAALAEQFSSRDTLRSMPAGQETHLAGSLEQVFASSVDAHLSAIVMVTDGRPTLQEDWSKVVQLSRARGTPILAVAVGSPDAPVDVAVRGAKADGHVYISDQVAVQCIVEESGLAAGSTFEIQLRDAASNEIHARRIITAKGAQSSHEIELRFKPKSTGLTRLVLEIPPLEQELQTANNAQQLDITIIDDKMRVLYVDGYPRYEYRYLKNTLLRETSLVCSTLLLSADQDFAQEGDHPIRRFPRDEEEINEFDVILFGDVDPKAGWISQSQMELIVDFVARRGGGFGIIAGEWHGPQVFVGTPLEKLIPVQIGGPMGDQGGSSSASRPANERFRPQLTASGRESSLFKLLLDEPETQEAFQRLPFWYWFNPVQGTKPGAEVLLQHPEPAIDPTQHYPLVVVGRHGAGRVFYQGSDDTWRWRRHNGEWFFDAYWIQVIRYLGRNKKVTTGDGMVLRVHQQKVDRANPIVLSLEFEEAALSSQFPDNVTLAVRSAAGIEMSEVTLTRLTADSKRFQGSYLPAATGQIEFEFDPQRYSADLAPVGLSRVSTLVQVERQSLEHRHAQVNLKLLREIAEQTGGHVLSPDEAGAIHEYVPDRKYVIPDDLTETIWDSKLALALFVILVTGEWIMRKLSGLT